MNKTAGEPNTISLCKDMEEEAPGSLGSGWEGIDGMEQEGFQGGSREPEHK